MSEDDDIMWLALGMFSADMADRDRGQSRWRREQARLSKEYWRTTAQRNAKLLEELQKRLTGHHVKVFGSSVSSWRRLFVYERCSGQMYPELRSKFDLDLMIEVDMPTWHRWAAAAYQGGSHSELPTVENDQYVYAYSESSPTCEARKQASIELGFDLEVQDVRLDVFLFPHEFCAGEMDIPVWNDPRRSFRNEVLAGIDLHQARPGKVRYRKWLKA